MPWSGIAGAAIGAAGSLIGGGISASNARDQMAMQKEFAQNGIRWKVADAKAAGIHPLAALGAQTFSYNPVMVGDYGISDAFQQMGQGVTRAQEAKQMQEERAATDAVRAEQAKGLRLDNQMKELQIQGEYTRQAYELADRVAAKTALPPPMPKVNDNGKSVSSDIRPLMSPARIGNSVLLHINSDISDAITEDALRNLYANIAAEAQAGKISPEVIKLFTKKELDAVARGDATIEYHPPTTWQFLWKPHMMPHYDGNRQTVRGKLFP